MSRRSSWSSPGRTSPKPPSSRRTWPKWHLRARDLRRRGRLPLHHPRPTHGSPRAPAQASTAGSGQEGSFLATMAVAANEGRDEDWEGWGAPMVWSHYDRDANVAMLREAGFEIHYAEPRTGGHRRRRDLALGPGPQVVEGRYQVTTITGVVARDIRFPTSENLDGSDAMNQAPDYSAAYAILEDGYGPRRPRPHLHHRARQRAVRRRHRGAGPTRRRKDARVVYARTWALSGAT